MKITMVFVVNFSYTNDDLPWLMFVSNHLPTHNTLSTALSSLATLYTVYLLYLSAKFTLLVYKTLKIKFFGKFKPRNKEIS